LKEATRQASIDIGNFSDFDLTGSTSSTYGAETHPAATAATDWHGVESGAPTTVSASEVPGAESHGLLLTDGQATNGHESTGHTSAAEGSSPVIHAAEETVARGTVARSDSSAPTQLLLEDALLLEDPLHETRKS
jgi:hypothetical protein